MKIMWLLYQYRGLANIDQSINDNTQVAKANINEIAIVKAIKNNGDRVVDTCVQDDTLVLSAKGSSPFSVASSMPNKVQQCEENLDQIFEYGCTYDHDFTLKDNDKGD
ncbi:hypothetical protein H5410_014371 [Solanum commersonii]|uniref:Uncharacterized protein n=1 Tax=Solanum commersonii TaxID=4109 RepID=A0A9J5ZR20_SOLCO|nr:hypothetical protein H5410_014371 [Solanum commersonii]